MMASVGVQHTDNDNEKKNGIFFSDDFWLRSSRHSENVLAKKKQASIAARVRLKVYKV